MDTKTFKSGKEVLQAKGQSVGKIRWTVTENDDGITKTTLIVMGVSGDDFVAPDVGDPLTDLKVDKTVFDAAGAIHGFTLVERKATGISN